MIQGSCWGSIVPASCPGITRPLEWTNRSGKTTLVGKLFAVSHGGRAGYSAIDADRFGWGRPERIHRQFRVSCQHDVMGGGMFVGTVCERTTNDHIGLR